MSTLGSYFVAKLLRSGRNADVAGWLGIFSGGFYQTAAVNVKQEGVKNVKAKSKQNAEAVIRKMLQKKAGLVEFAC